MADKRSPSRRFLPPDPQRRGAVPAHAEARPASRDPRHARARGLRDALPSSVVAAGPERRAAPARVAEQSAPGHPRASSAWPDSRSQRGRARDERSRAVRSRSGQSDLPKRRGVRLREIRALARVLGLPANQIGAAIRRHRHDPLTPIRIKDSASRAQVFYLEERAEDFPGVQIVPAYLRYYPQSGACRARARLRRRDLAGAAEGAAQPGVQRRRHDRPDRNRVVLRQVPTRDRRCLAVARRLARQADQPRRAEGPGASRQRGPPDARREAAEGRRGGAAVRHRTRAQLAVLRLLVLERRRDRRARPAATARSARSRRPRRIRRRSMSVACASGRSTPPV